MSYPWYASSRELSLAQSREMKQKEKLDSKCERNSPHHCWSGGTWQAEKETRQPLEAKMVPWLTASKAKEIVLQPHGIELSQYPNEADSSTEPLEKCPVQMTLWFQSCEILNKGPSWAMLCMDFWPWSCEIINGCCFKLPKLWSFITTAIEN